MEKFNEVIKSPEEEAEELYDSLPESMKIGYYGLVPEGELYKTAEEAAQTAIKDNPYDVLPKTYVIVEFKDGRKISLHLDYKAAKDELPNHIQKQIDAIMKGSEEADNIEKIETVWKP
jgi:hypothetical protein